MQRRGTESPCGPDGRQPPQPPAFASRDQVDLLFNELARCYQLFLPQRHGGSLVLSAAVDETGPISLEWNDYRLAEPLKSIWFQPATVLAEWPDGLASGTSNHPPRAIAGAKACDLAALQVLDRVLRVAPHDEPAYSRARDQNLIISGDCTGHGSTCFCTMLDRLPYPSDGFDLNLSPCGQGYLVDAGSDRGSQILDDHPHLFRAAYDKEVDTRDRVRIELADRIREQNVRFRTLDPFAVSIEKNLKTRIWGELAASCVECSACNYVCPTCYCFLLHDCRVASIALRFSLWDSCFHAGHARMAGGGTPRLQLTERFKNHYYHKFVAFPKSWSVVGCTGCGRCIDGCMGRIDKRECLHRLETWWIPSEVVEEM